MLEIEKAYKKMKSLILIPLPYLEQSVPSKIEGKN